MDTIKKKQEKVKSNNIINVVWIIYENAEKHTGFCRNTEESTVFRMCTANFSGSST